MGKKKENPEDKPCEDEHEKQRKEGNFFPNRNGRRSWRDREIQLALLNFQDYMFTGRRKSTPTPRLFWTLSHRTRGAKSLAGIGSKLADASKDSVNWFFFGPN
ncbi:hypothetical protein SLE2022_089590 [Rubroshorea leprosula]